MRKALQYGLSTFFAATGAGACGWGYVSGQSWSYVAGAVALTGAAVTLALRNRRKIVDDESPDRPAVHRLPRPTAAADRTIDSSDASALVGQMLDEKRYSLLLRPQVAAQLTDAHFAKALAAVSEWMALVPDGEVALEENGAQRVIPVSRFFLDRHQVTNQEYFEFVAAGGYRQSTLWDESILPAVLDFVDRTGKPGPKYWFDGYYPDGEEKLPVVGVSWYEACAYARWIGKRLPSDAEWVKAGSWPVPLNGETRSQRKYPWGDAMDRARANLWGSGPGCIVPVDCYPNGVSVGGVHQLIGNVWEWTASPFRGASLSIDDLPSGGAVFIEPMKSVRGGAFDTYFDNQATCQFQSGESPLHRRHNVGFRCAIGVCDLTLVRKNPGEKTPVAEVPTTAPEDLAPACAS